MDKGQGIVDSDEPMSFERLCEAEPALDLFAHVSPLVEKVYNEGRQFGVRQERVASRDRLTGLNVVNAVYLLKVIAADLGLEYADRSHEEHFEAIRRRLTQLNAAEMEHKMAAAEWSAARTELLRRLDVAIPSSRRRYNRIQDLEQALAATGVYLAGLKIYDEDPTARRIVERNLELLRNGTGAQGSGVGEERATCGKCGATVVEALAGVTVDAGEEQAPAPHDFEAKDGAMYCRRCDDPGAPSCVGAVISSRLGEPVYCDEGMCDHRYCTNLKPEPLTVFESHLGKVGGGPFGQQNTAAMNGETYNAVAARLRKEIPISDPIWEGAGSREAGAGTKADAYQFDEDDAVFFALCQPARVAYSETADLPGMLCDYANRINGGLGPGAESLCDEMGHYGRAQYAQGWSKCEAVYRGIIQTGALTGAVSDEYKTAVAQLERLREAYYVMKRYQGRNMDFWIDGQARFDLALAEVFPDTAQRVAQSIADMKSPAPGS